MILPAEGAAQAPVDAQSGTEAPVQATFGWSLVQVARVGSIVLGGALLVAPWLSHFDDTDAHVYQVVVRNMVRSGAWFDPRYLEHLYPHFREHLPFGFWPYAFA